MDKKKLTTKQQRFVDFYDGNATEACRKAGYKGSKHTLEQVAYENLRKPEIVAAIKPSFHDSFMLRFAKVFGTTSPPHLLADWFVSLFGSECLCLPPLQFFRLPLFWSFTHPLSSIRLPI